VPINFSAAWTPKGHPRRRGWPFVFQTASFSPIEGSIHKGEGVRGPRTRVQKGSLRVASWCSGSAHRGRCGSPQASRRAACSSLGLRGRDFSRALLDQTVDCGQVGPLRWAVEPGVNLDALEEKVSQDRVTLV
jgi:hypothetical protein